MSSKKGRNNKHFNTAKSAKDDEFYTMYEDVEKELLNYKKHLKGKVVYCNCDDFKTSEFVKFFINNYNYFEIKGLYASSFREGSNHSSLFFYNGVSSFISEVEGDGSYDSPYSEKILKISDVVVTNPPFSKIKNLIPYIMERGKDLVVMSHISSYTTNSIRKYISDGSLKFGFKVSETIKFIRPNGSLKPVPINWLTTFDVYYDKNYECHNKLKTLNEPLLTDWINNCQTIDGLGILTVDRCLHIPSDYKGLVAAPISIAKYVDNSKFRIIDVLDNSRVDGDAKFIRTVVSCNEKG